MLFRSTHTHTHTHTQIVPIVLTHLTKLSSVRVYLPKDLRPSENRRVVRTAMQEVSKRFPHGLPLLDPVKDMHIGEEEFKKIVRVRGSFVSLSISACVCLSVGPLSRGLSLSVCQSS